MEPTWSKQINGQQDPRSEKQWFIKPTWLVRLGRPTASRFLSLFTNITLTGTKNLPPTGPFILAANHVSMVDSIILNALLPRYPFFMAKSELFSNPAMAWFLRHAGAFPVYRGARDQWALQQAMRILEAGQVLGIYPEGTRSKEQGRLGKAKTGAVRLALAQQVPIVPVAITGSAALLKLKRNLLRSIPIHVHIGELFDVCNRVSEHTPSNETIRALSTELMVRIARMLPPEKRGMYAHLVS